MVVLQACHLAELTGYLRARRGASLVSVSFAAGEVLSADALDGVACLGGGGARRATRRP